MKIRIFVLFPKKSYHFLEIYTRKITPPPPVIFLDEQRIVTLLKK